MRQFYTMHEHKCTEIQTCNKQINKISLLTKNTQTKQNTIIRQKQSLVHKVPSGVAILSHGCGVAAKTSTLKILSKMANVWRQGILVFY
jgi:Fe-S-cluster-containing hydrogenase component 2